MRNLLITVVLLLALAVPAVAQEEQLNQINIVCYLVNDESMPTDNNFIAIVPYQHLKFVGIPVNCVASDSICKKVIKYLRHANRPVKVIISGRLGLSGRDTLSIYVHKLWLISNK